MGKKSKSQPEKQNDSEPASNLPFLSGKTSFDPALASLFEQSAGPVKEPSVKYVPPPKAESRKTEEDVDQNEIEESDEEVSFEDEVMDDAARETDSDSESAQATEEASQSRKRKRAPAEEIEESYMRRVAKEEQVEAQKRRSEKAKRQKVESAQDSDTTEEEEESEEDTSEDETSDKENETKSVPVHESLTGDAQANMVEKSNRTVFLGNVSTEAIKSKSAKKTLLKHLGSFLSTLPESTGPHKVESIRFRSTPFTSGGHIPKRASFARKEILDDTTPSTNAYAVYTTQQAARKAPAALNGTLILDRHIRVDNVAHPSPTDHKRCIFVGNLDFMDKEFSSESEEGKKKKNNKPADVEEGLWRTFGGSETGTSTKVESVRVVRDRATRVGKGFAYVQFYDQNGVEEALLLDGKKFPPMLPRKLRVMRAKKERKTTVTPKVPVKGQKLGEAQKTFHGRAGKLLGKAGAAKLKAGVNAPNPHTLVFEGHRATEDGSRIKVKTKSRGSKGKPKTRSTKRAAAYRAGKTKKEKS
ncbi:nucleolar protein 12 [Aspergillus sclerotialis]|uniref:Nucleolar protein 12 n=1 Tax=Aspergillus sclerotialis TaxID=2070753 RepID=A0A3A2ZE30_9EURO|nr:nucleolar protein 12 [Aspergillus sclerotialis]